MRAAVLCAGAILAVAPAAAQSPSDPWKACDVAAAQAEHDFGLPGGLLAAIGLVESGRWNAVSRRSSPWPYAIDVGGYDLFLESPEAAAAKVRALQTQGVRSMDVGCFQINLMHHPDAFASVEEAFDPAANATYAAHFLRSLLRRTGSWQAAVAGYHSLAPGVGEPYRDRVFASWSGDSVSLADPTRDAGPAMARQPAAAWGWMSTVSVQVIVPAFALPTLQAAHVETARFARQFTAVAFMVPRQGRLPRVLEPTGD